MFGPNRGGAVRLVIITYAALAACSSPPPKPAPPPSATLPPPKPAAVFSLDTPVHIIAADPRGKAILQRDIPGLMSNRSYILFDDMSLAQIASVSGGRFSTAKLNQIELDLARIKEP